MGLLSARGEEDEGVAPELVLAPGRELGARVVLLGLEELAVRPEIELGLRRQTDHVHRLACHTPTIETLTGINGKMKAAPWKPRGAARGVVVS